jgi:long-chain acyl-CoA synthetase
MGYMDEEDYLFITDRKSDMVISGGVNIYPREIENCLYDMDEVVDCAVFGVPDEKWGESLVAVVQPRIGSGLDEATIRAWVREHLADYKTPRYFEFIDELPRDPNGKVVKRKLRTDYVAALSALSSSSSSGGSSSDVT